MPQFEYKVVDSSGQEFAGVFESASKRELEQSLKQQGYTVRSINEQGGDKAAADKTKTKEGGKGKVFSSRRAKVKSKELMLFTRQLATLIDAGLPLLRGLSVLGKQEPNPALKSTISDISDSVQSGSTFSESLGGHPKIFNKLYVNMVKAGELGGVLEVVLDRLAEYQEKAQKLKNKVVSALAYPVIVLCIAVLIVIFLMIFIVPKFEEMFDDLLQGEPLPAITRLVVGISNAFVARWIFGIPNVVILLVLVFGLGFGSKALAGTEGGRRFLDQAKLRIPLFGDIQRKTAIARFCRTLGTLVSSGVPILQALNITRETAGNEVVAESVHKIHESVKEGEPIVSSMEASPVFPPMVVSMVDVGEETGQLPDMLLKVAELYDDEVDNAVAAATSMLEPIMIVMLAIVVGTIVISLFLPLAKIIQGLSAQA